MSNLIRVDCEFSKVAQYRNAQLLSIKMALYPQTPNNFVKY